MFEKINESYNCAVCSLEVKCQLDRVCLQCGKMKKSTEWCIKKSEILCLSCFEKGNYEPLYLIKKNN